MKKTAIMLFVLLVLSACSSISHKAFRLTTQGTGGKFTVIDPAGSGTPAPSIVLGAFYSSITTIPPNTKAEWKSTSYELFSGHKLYEEEMTIDTTNNKNIVTESIKYYNDTKKAK